MGRIKPLEKSEVSGEALVVYEEIEKAFGRVPNLFKTYAHFPLLLRANWEKRKAVMLGGSLPRVLKEEIALVVSQANGCRYCVVAHSAALKRLGVPEEKVTALLGDLGKAGLSEKERALLEFTRQASVDPHQVTDEDVRRLRELFSDAEIIEALGVMEVYTGFNKFLDCLDVEIDF